MSEPTEPAKDVVNPAKSGDYSYIGALKMKNRILDPTQPFGLPKGTIRAFLTIMVIWTTLYIESLGVPASDKLWDLTFMFGAFYVGSRMNFNNGDKP